MNCAEKQKALLGALDSLGTSKFSVPNVPLSDIIERLGNDDGLVLMATLSDEERAVIPLQGRLHVLILTQCLKSICKEKWFAFALWVTSVPQLHVRFLLHLRFGLSRCDFFGCR